MMHVKTVILGSGISGLSAAHFLSKKTNDFLLLESDNEAGGIIKTVNHGDFICENGPNTVLLNNDAIKELVKDCGLMEKIMFPSKVNNNRYVLHNNEITSIPLNILSFLKTPLISLKGKLRLVGELFVAKHKKNTTVYNFIKTRFGKEFHDQLIEPFLTGVYAGNTKNMSAKHCLKLLWNLEQNYGSIIRGLMKSKNVPKDSFYFPNGLKQLISSIKKPLENNIKLGHKVIQIINHKSFYEVICDNYKFSCTNIISAIPAYALSNVVWDMNFSNVLKSVNYNPIDVFHFGFLKKDLGIGKKGFGVLTKPMDGKHFLGILFNSQIFNHVSPKDKQLFTVLVGGERQNELCSMDKNELEQIVLNEIKDLLNCKDNPVFKNHFKWKMGIPQYDMNQSRLIKSIEEFENSNLSFHVLGNFFSGISVSDCVKNAKNKIDIMTMV